MEVFCTTRRDVSHIQAETKQALVCERLCYFVVVFFCLAFTLCACRLLSRAGSSMLNEYASSLFSPFLVVAKISSCCLLVAVMRFILNRTDSSVYCLLGCTLATAVFVFLSMDTGQSTLTPQQSRSLSRLIKSTFCLQAKITKKARKNQQDKHCNFPSLNNYHLSACSTGS